MSVRVKIYFAVFGILFIDVLSAHENTGESLRTRRLKICGAVPPSVSVRNAHRIFREEKRRFVPDGDPWA